MRDRPNAAHAIRPMGFEAVEVVSAFEALRGASHGEGIERAEDAPTVPELERVGDRAVVDDITIEFSFGVDGGVEGLRHLAGVENANVARKHRIQRADENFGFMF